MTPNDNCEETSDLFVDNDTDWMECKQQEMDAGRKESSLKSHWQQQKPEVPCRVHKSVFRPGTKEATKNCQNKLTEQAVLKVTSDHLKEENAGLKLDLQAAVGLKQKLETRACC